MLRQSSSIFLLMLLSVLLLNAQTPAPERSQTLVKGALSSAGSSGKTVFVIFPASWCGWCKKLEAALESAELKPTVERYFVAVRLDVLEQGDKKASLENPGGAEMMKELGGEKSGLPFYAFLDAKGTKIADSNVMPKGMNIGYPGSPDEIVAFMKVARTAAPAMTDAEASAMSDYFATHAPR